MRIELSQREIRIPLCITKFYIIVLRPFEILQLRISYFGRCTFSPSLILLDQQPCVSLQMTYPRSVLPLFNVHMSHWPLNLLVRQYLVSYELLSSCIWIVIYLFLFHDTYQLLLCICLKFPFSFYRKLCCSTIKSLFTNEGKHGGEVTLEAVRLIADHVKAHNCQFHPDSVDVQPCSSDICIFFLKSRFCQFSVSFSNKFLLYFVWWHHQGPACLK